MSDQIRIRMFGGFSLFVNNECFDQVIAKSKKGMSLLQYLILKEDAVILNYKLIEVLWPNGRLLREYTLLLDPPLYTPQSVIPAAAQLPVAAPAPAPRIQPPVARPAIAAVQPTAPAADRPLHDPSGRAHQ